MLRPVVRMSKAELLPDTAVLPERLITTLPPSEHATEVPRILRFRRGVDKKRALLARLLLLRAAQEVLGLRWEVLHLARTKERKPYVETTGLMKAEELLIATKGTGLFNLNASHHGEWVVAAWHTEYLVGVDVMCYEVPRDSVEAFFGRMMKQFTPQEWEVIRAPESERGRLVLFYRLWSLKESYIKAVGIGLGFDLQRANFFFPDKDDDSIAQVAIDGKIRFDWYFFLRDIDEQHCLALALGPFTEAVSGIFSCDSSCCCSSDMEDSTSVNPSNYLKTAKELFSRFNFIYLNPEDLMNE